MYTIILNILGIAIVVPLLSWLLVTLEQANWANARKTRLEKKEKR